MVIFATSSVMTRRDSVVFMDDIVKAEGGICKTLSASLKGRSTETKFMRLKREALMQSIEECRFFKSDIGFHSVLQMENPLQPSMQSLVCS